PVGGLPGGVCGGAAATPTTWTAAWPFRVPARASTIATPPPTPVTVPLLSTRATATLFDDQMMRTVGITFPTRSNAVARSPLRSPIRIVTEGGATCTSALFCADNAPGEARTVRRRLRRAVRAARREAGASTVDRRMAQDTQ